MTDSCRSDEHWLLSAADEPSESFDQILAWLVQRPDLVRSLKVNRTVQHVAFRASAVTVGELRLAFPLAALKIEPDTPLEMFRAAPHCQSQRSEQAV